MNSVSDIYDRLYSFEGKRKKGPYPIHKRLKINSQEDGLIHWLMQKIAFTPGENVLDVGCGTGYTLFQLAKAIQIAGTGISISKKEIEHANDQLRNFDSKHNLKFEVCDFHQKVSGHFDKIIAIESLKHALSIGKVISNLSAVLENDGRLVVADDFVLASNHLSEKHKLLWNSPALLSAAEFEKIICELGFKVEIYDLTKHVPVRPKALLTFLIYSISLFQFLFGRDARINLDTYRGALLLEQLYADGKMQYCVIVATRQNQTK